MSGYDYKALKNTDAASGFTNDDRVLIVTPEGVRQVNREAIVGALGGANIKDWDGRASREQVGAVLIPFTRTQLVPGSLDDAPSIPTVNGNQTIVTKSAANADGKGKSYWSLRGSIPDIGADKKFWVGFEADCSDAATTHRIYVGQQIVPELIDAVAGNCACVIEITKTQIKATRLDTEMDATVTVNNVLQKVMIQVNDDTIDIYATAGLFLSVPRPVDDLLIGGAIISAANVPQTLTLNVTNSAVLPHVPDAGYLPIDMLDSVLPNDAFATDILYTRTATVFRDMFLAADTFYVIGAGEELVAILDENDLALLSRENIFQQRLGFSASYVLSAGEYPSTAVFLGKRTSQAFDAFDFARLSDTALFGNAFANIGTGNYSGLYGFGSVFGSIVDGNGNLGVGNAGNALATASIANTFMGVNVANQLTGSNYVTAVGYYTCSNSTVKLTDAIFMGAYAGADWTNANTESIQGNVGLGSHALRDGPMGNYNIALGYESLRATPATTSTYTADYNVSIGYRALKTRNGALSSNVAIGKNAMQGSAAASLNVMIGQGAGVTMLGNGNVGVGTDAASAPTGALVNCTAVGRGAMASRGVTTNSTALGANATVTGSNQVQLGDSSTTTYAYGAVQSRSDERDKTGVRPGRLGLQFILALKPVDYQWDYREDYLQALPKPTEPSELYAEPQQADFIGALVKGDSRYDAAYNAFLRAHLEWRTARDYRETAMETYRKDLSKWRESQDLANVVKDGTKTRARYHHGFIAQQVKEVADKFGADFGGYQDHALSGGEDVKSLGYEEFISPMVLAIQELNQKLTAPELLDLITDRALKRIATDSDSPLLDIIAEKMLAKLSAARRR